VATQNSDGSIAISGANVGNTYGGNLALGTQTGSGNNWTGIAFGGGAYFEATFSFTGQGNGPYNNGGPAFWALDIEHLSQGPYNTSWAGTANPWNSSTTYSAHQVVTYNGWYWFSIAGGNLNNAPPHTTPTTGGNSYWAAYQNWTEVDFMEYNNSEYTIENNIGNWTDFFGSTSNPYGIVPVSGSTNFAEPHVYGCLWVPATPSTQGYLKFYMDGVQTSQTFYWDYYDLASPPAPTPVNGSTAMSVMDLRHLMLILGTGTDQPMTVQSVSVWQASSANNITQ
jgi:hypothetical protein